jgi:CRISPR-associated Csx14 family protein
LYYKNKDGDIIILELTIEGGIPSYEELNKTLEHNINKYKNDFIRIKDEEPTELNNLDYKKEGILLCPLGESPMIVTQTYILLKKRENVNIKKICVIYPENNGDILRTIDWIKKATESLDRSIKIESVPIEKYSDIDSEDACRDYLKTLETKVNELRTQHKEFPIYMSLSGGRKGMSVLTYFSAQINNVNIYHTLITNPTLEDEIENNYTYQELKRMNETQRTEILSLKSLGLSQFTIFKIPMIPIDIIDDK